MSRIAKAPLNIPSGVEIGINGQELSIKGPKWSFDYSVHALVDVTQKDGVVLFKPKSKAKSSRVMAATMRALAGNMVIGVVQGFEKKLELVGVGYRAKAQGNKLNLTLGFSHPVVYELPKGVTVETPKQTEIIVRGADKQQVGQVAAEIRAYRPPEPYKGKGVKYVGEHIVRKEAKKK